MFEHRSHFINTLSIPSELTLTLRMTTAQVVETPVTDNNNSPIQDYFHPDDHTQPTYEWKFLVIVLRKYR